MIQIFLEITKNHHLDSKRTILGGLAFKRPSTSILKAKYKNSREIGLELSPYS